MACGIKHPNDLDADNIGGNFKKIDKVRFYEYDDQNAMISTVIHPVRDENGKVIGGTMNQREVNKWEKIQTNLTNMYAVIRRHKATKMEGRSFVRQVVYVMTINEYNDKYSFSAKVRSLQLRNSYIILSYSMPKNTNIPETSHGNSKSTSTIFRTTEHSFKKELHEKVKNTTDAPSIIMDSFESETSIFEETPNIRNKKQIYNIRANSKCNED